MGSPISDVKPDDILEGRYRVLNLLGRGGMATVYRVMDLAHGSEIALKLLSINVLDMEAGVKIEHFRNEFQILRRLNLPNIVSVHEEGISDSGIPYFTMELLIGETLSSLISEGNILAEGDASLPSRLSILEQIAAALKHVHHQGYLYCDLKPSNVFILKCIPPAPSRLQQRLKLFDFGIAQPLRGSSPKTPQFDEKTRGTPYYMSPEQIRGDTLDVRSDIYSFGVLAFELLTGTPPFLAETEQEAAVRHSIGKAPSIREINRKVPPALERMVSICMEKDREHRYGSMDEVLERLKNISEARSANTMASRAKQIVVDFLTR